MDWLTILLKMIETNWNALSNPSVAFFVAILGTFTIFKTQNRNLNTIRDNETNFSILLELERRIEGINSRFVRTNLYINTLLPLTNNFMRSIDKQILNNENNEIIKKYLIKLKEKIKKICEKPIISIFWIFIGRITINWYLTHRRIYANFISNLQIRPISNNNAHMNIIRILKFSNSYRSFIAFNWIKRLWG